MTSTGSMTSAHSHSRTSSTQPFHDWRRDVVRTLYHTTWTFLKTAHLFILLPSLARIFGHSKHEIPGEHRKVILHHSRLRAVVQSLVHFLPVSAVLGIISINLNQVSTQHFKVLLQYPNLVTGPRVRRLPSRMLRNEIRHLPP